MQFLVFAYAMLVAYVAIDGALSLPASHRRNEDKVHQIGSTIQNDLNLNPVSQWIPARNPKPVSTQSDHINLFNKRSKRSAEDESFPHFYKRIFMDPPVQKLDGGKEEKIDESVLSIEDDSLLTQSGLPGLHRRTKPSEESESLSQIFYRALLGLPVPLGGNADKPLEDGMNSVVRDAIDGLPLSPFQQWISFYLLKNRPGNQRALSESFNRTVQSRTKRSAEEDYFNKVIWPAFIEMQKEEKYYLPYGMFWPWLLALNG
ncbi:unnamed protein product [Orchesella dallaii]|uniref:Secreted RxLR effector peptide protein n=1 Tax=Orchesella dallaii TaxID=48710 RepID=A0ABP1R036_9HEXA